MGSLPVFWCLGEHRFVKNLFKSILVVEKEERESMQEPKLSMLPTLRLLSWELGSRARETSNSTRE